MTEKKKEPHYECCITCGSHTGKAGRDEDSIYIETLGDDIGPLCEGCYARIKEQVSDVKEGESK